MQATVNETATADGEVASQARSAMVAKPFPLGRGIFSRRKVVLAIYALLLLAVLAALAEAKAVVLPLATAFLLSFLFRPVVRRAEALRVPAPLVAALLVLILGVGLGFSVYALKDPATDWLREAPYSLKQLEYRIAELRKPIADMKAASDALEDLRGGDAQADKEVVVKEQALDEIVVIETSSALMSLPAGAFSPAPVWAATGVATSNNPAAPSTIASIPATARSFFTLFIMEFPPDVRLRAS